VCVIEIMCNGIVFRCDILNVVHVCVWEESQLTVVFIVNVVVVLLWFVQNV